MGMEVPNPKPLRDQAQVGLTEPAPLETPHPCESGLGMGSEDSGEGLIREPAT